MLDERVDKSGDRGKGGWAFRSNAYAWWVTAVLTMGMMLSMIDRMVLPLMVQHVKADLQVNDTAVSLLQGLAFTMLYVVVGLPLGRLADQWSRRAVIAWCILAWSFMTLLCGLSTNFWQLFLARIGVGIGEAGLSPAAVSLLSDYFPPEQRARPLLCVMLGATLGVGLSFILSGSVLHYLDTIQAVEMPLLGAVRGWQVVFILLGVFGLAYPLLMLSVREPQRRERISQSSLTFRDTTAYLWSLRPVLAPLFLGVATTGMIMMAMNLWLPAMLIRRFEWNVATVGWAYGACLAGSGVTSALISSLLVTRLSKPGDQFTLVSIAIGAVLVACPCLFLATVISSGISILPLVALGFIALGIPVALGPIYVQSACANEVRGQAIAAYVLVVAVVSNILGPSLVAVITDYVIGDPKRVNFSLAIVIAVVLPVSAFMFKLARDNFNRQSGETSAQAFFLQLKPAK